MADILYAPILGQSNGRNMQKLGDDADAGYTKLTDTLTALTGLEAHSLFDSSTGNPISPAVGGSTVDGDNTSNGDEKIWWYPDSGTPGGALTRAINILKQGHQQLSTKGDVKMSVLWSQGESNAALISQPSTDPDEMQARYQQATSDIFDYIKAELDTDIDFYIIQTGFRQETGSINSGFSLSSIEKVREGVERVRESQEALTETRDDVHLAVNYDDLMLDYETGDLSKREDGPHLGLDSYEVVGIRAAEYIAQNLGYNNTLSDPSYVKGSNGSDTLEGTNTDDVIEGSGGNDVLRGLSSNDYLLGGTGADQLFGDQGNDSLLGGSGNDELYGGSGNDALHGRADNDLINGETGNDFLLGGAGNDTINGGADNDFLEGNEGSDLLTGGDGADIFRIANKAHSHGNEHDIITDFEIGIDKIDLSKLGFNDISTTEAIMGELSIRYSEAENLTWITDEYGSGFTLALQGDLSTQLSYGDFILDGTPNQPGVNQFRGTELNDIIQGSGGDDLLLGFGGNDKLDGRAGNDTLDGGAGRDLMTGGSGADVFRFNSRMDSRDDNAEFNNQYDGITDFEVGIDKLDLSAIGFVRLDNDGGQTEIGELRMGYSSNTDRTYLRTDQFDFEFYLEGDYRTTLTDNDFIIRDNKDLEPNDDLSETPELEPKQDELPTTENSLLEEDTEESGSTSLISVLQQTAESQETPLLQQTPDFDETTETMLLEETVQLDTSFDVDAIF